MKYQLGLVVNSSLAHNSILPFFERGGGGRVNIGPSVRTTTLQKFYDINP